METATSTLALMPNTKQEILTFSEKLKEELQSGYVNPLDLLRGQKAIEKVFANIKEDLTKATREEAEKYGKSFEYKGSKIELAEVGVKYDYSECGDYELNEILEQIAKLEEKKKAREAFLKTLKEPMQIITKDGEPIEVYPPKKSSTSSIKITI